MHLRETTRMPVVSIILGGVQITDFGFTWGVSAKMRIILVVKASLRITLQESVCHCIPPFPLTLGRTEMGDGGIHPG